MFPDELYNDFSCTVEAEYFLVDVAHVRHEELVLLPVQNVVHGVVSLLGRHDEE